MSEEQFWKSCYASTMRALSGVDWQTCEKLADEAWQSNASGNGAEAAKKDMECWS